MCVLIDCLVFVLGAWWIEYRWYWPCPYADLQRGLPSLWVRKIPISSTAKRKPWSLLQCWSSASWVNFHSDDFHNAILTSSLMSNVSPLWCCPFLIGKWINLIEIAVTVISLVLQQRLKKRSHMPRRTASVVSTMSMSSMSSASSSDLEQQNRQVTCSTGSIAKLPHHPPLSRSSSMVMEAFTGHSNIKPSITLDTLVQFFFESRSRWSEIEKLGEFRNDVISCDVKTNIHRTRSNSAHAAGQKRNKTKSKKNFHQQCAHLYMKARKLPNSRHVKWTERQIIKVRQFHFTRQTWVTHPHRSKWSKSIKRNFYFVSFFQLLQIYQFNPT